MKCDYCGIKYKLRDTAPSHLKKYKKHFCSLFCRNESYKTHGMSYTKIYRIWAGMKKRCFNIKDKRFSSYGGRGITVCKRWMKFENFLEDMGDRPKGLMLERIDNNGNYYKKNCRWATCKEQANNKRSNRRLFFNGKEYTITEWAKKIRLNKGTLFARIYLGWSIRKALTTKLESKYSHPKTYPPHY